MSTDAKRASESRRINLPNNLAPMLLEGNLAVNWKKWLQSFKIFMRASGINDESEERKVAVFLHYIGEKSLEIFNTFNLDVDTVKYDVLIQKFENYFVPKTNITYESYKFFTRKQNEEESLDDFMTDLINKSESCDFGSIRDRLVKDIYICNLHQKYQFVREKLLLEDDLSLEKASSISKTLVQSLTQASELKGSTNVYYTNKQNHQSHGHGSNMSKSRSKSQSRNGCGRCGQIHRYKCPAANAKCRKCGKIGHYEALCKSKNIHFVQFNDESQYEGKCHIDVNTDVPLKIDAPRRIPFSLHDRLKKVFECNGKLRCQYKSH
ncbi:hypothetical protein evm_004146 [Chilo suppressalis]|nr:hypothetical protein evm_004146 [Chilo suppressalis]